MKTATKFTRPNVVISKCLCGVRCRWDGNILSYPFVRALRQYARIIPVCPEIEIGLGVPRNQINLIRESNRTSLFQLGTNRRLARKMNSFAQAFLSSHADMDGFILKHKSPSCGLRGVKLYESTRPDASFERRGTGLFAAQVLERFPHSAIEDDERLEDHRIREQWLTRLFALAAFRIVRKSHSLNRLRAFHLYYRSLLNAHNQRFTREVDRIYQEIRTATNYCAEIEQYEAILHRILSKPPRRSSAIRPFELARRHYSKSLNADEKKRFRQQLRRYRDGRIPLSDIRNTVQIWAVRYDKAYTRQSAVFRPYPSMLADS